MSEKGYDLHMHSTCSDGTATPKELIDGAKLANLKGISITDHDTTAAYTKDLFDYAKEQNIGVIQGAEFSTFLDKTPIHILAYGYDIENQSLKDLCLAHINRRKDRNDQILASLKKHSIDISYEELLLPGSHVIGRPHIAKALMEKGVVSSIKEAFDIWIGDDRKCFAAGVKFKPQETIDIIHGAGGLAVLAHPILLKKKGLIKNILNQFNFDGMECYYAAFSESQKYQMVKIAKEYDLIMTGGSDFHGETKPYIKIGASYTNDDEMNKLRRL